MFVLSQLYRLIQKSFGTIFSFGVKGHSKLIIFLTNITYSVHLLGKKSIIWPFKIVSMGCIMWIIIIRVRSVWNEICNIICIHITKIRSGQKRCQDYYPTSKAALHQHILHVKLRSTKITPNSHCEFSARPDNRTVMGTWLDGSNILSLSFGSIFKTSSSEYTAVQDDDDKENN